MHHAIRPPHRPVLFAGAVVIVLAGLTGCSKDGGEPPDGGSIAGLLAAVPDTKENRQYVIVNRYDAAADGADITAEGGDDTEKQLDRLLQLSRQAGIAPTGVLDTSTGPDRLAALGFPPSDVAATVQAGNPPDTTDLAVVDTDEGDVLDEAAKVEGAERTEIGGVEVVRWLDDREIDPDLDTPIGRVPGAAGRVGFADDGLLVTATSDEVEERAIATVKGDRESLMDVGGIAAVADALDDEDAFTAFIAGVPLGPSSRTTPDQQEGQAAALRDYSAIGLGNTWSDDGLELVIAIAHDDESAAKANAAALEDAVTSGRSAQTSDRLSKLLEDPDIERDGTTVVGTFEIERPALWYQFVQRLEPFLFGGR